MKYLEYSLPVRGAWFPLIRLVLGTALLVAPACTDEGGSEPVTNSQTHWLKSCDKDKECGDLSCQCGVCTKSCDSTDACEGLSGSATCASIGNSEACGGAEEEQICLRECEEDSCKSGNECVDGACIPVSSGGEEDDDEPGPAGVDCGDYESCDLETRCESGFNCMALSGCNGAICIDPEEACELSCPDPKECGTLETYPGQLVCEGKVEAHPAAEDDDLPPADDDVPAADDVPADDVPAADDEPAADDDLPPADDDVPPPDDDMPMADDDLPPNPVPGIQCASYEACGESFACDSGQCTTVLGCEEPICIDTMELCERSCRVVGTCQVQESIPLGFFCEGQVPAVPGPSTPPEPVLPAGVQCGDYDSCSGAASGECANCTVVQGCDSPICIDTMEACALSCAPGQCEVLAEAPPSISCPDLVLATPGESPVADGGAPPPGVDCGAYPSCGIEGPCDGAVECIAFAECGGGRCVPWQSACELSCPQPGDCQILESFPAQLRCQGQVPAIPAAEPADEDAGTPPTLPSDLLLLDLNTPCMAGDVCPAGLEGIKHFGIAGPNGPEFCTCSIPCSEDATVCPAGSTCGTIADGPGIVCIAVQ